MAGLPASSTAGLNCAKLIESGRTGASLIVGLLVRCCESFLLLRVDATIHGDSLHHWGRFQRVVKGTVSLTAARGDLLHCCCRLLVILQINNLSKNKIMKVNHSGFWGFGE